MSHYLLLISFVHIDVDYLMLLVVHVLKLLYLLFPVIAYFLLIF